MFDICYWTIHAAEQEIIQKNNVITYLENETRKELLEELLISLPSVKWTGKWGLSV